MTVNPLGARWDFALRIPDEITVAMSFDLCRALDERVKAACAYIEHWVDPAGTGLQVRGRYLTVPWVDDNGTPPVTFRRRGAEAIRPIVEMIDAHRRGSTVDLEWIIGRWTRILVDGCCVMHSTDRCSDDVPCARCPKRTGVDR